MSNNKVGEMLEFTCKRCKEEFEYIYTKGPRRSICDDCAPKFGNEKRKRLHEERRAKGECPRCGEDDPARFSTIAVTNRRCTCCDRCNSLNAEKQEEWRTANPELAKERARESVENYREKYPERVDRAREIWFNSKTVEERRKYWRDNFRHYMERIKADEVRYREWRDKKNARCRELARQKKERACQ